MSASSSSTVGFIGLGAMGRPMAAKLCRKSLSLTVHDIEKAPLSALKLLGATIGGGAADVAQRSDVVFTMLPDSAAVESVIGGPDGVLAHLRPGGAVVDMSTIDP